MSQTVGAQYPVPTLTFYEDSYRSISGKVQQDFVTVGLLGGLYGILTILSLQSVHALIQRGGRARFPAIVLCLTLLALFTSTTIYIVIFILSHQSDLMKSFITSGRDMWIVEFGPPINFPVDAPLGSVRDYSRLEACVGTAALTVNVTLGDAIVCWRASTVWQKHRAVRMRCAIFVLATLALGAMSTHMGCHPSYVFYSTDVFSSVSDPVFLGTMYEGLPIGLATCVLSLSTNIIATLLVEYKAWESRRRLKGYLVSGSQVEKLLALLIESGTVYCAIWGAIVAFQVTQYRLWNLPPELMFSAQIGFFNVFAILVNAALVPAIGISPAIIIVLVALNRSHIEKGLTPHLESLPTPHLAITDEEMATSTQHDASRTYGQYAMLVVGGPFRGAGMIRGFGQW